MSTLFYASELLDVAKDIYLHNRAFSDLLQDLQTQTLVGTQTNIQVRELTGAGVLNDYNTSGKIDSRFGDINEVTAKVKNLELQYQKAVNDGIDRAVVGTADFETVSAQAIKEAINGSLLQSNKNTATELAKTDNAITLAGLTDANIKKFMQDVAVELDKMPLADAATLYVNAATYGAIMAVLDKNTSEGAYFGKKVDVKLEQGVYFPDGVVGFLGAKQVAVSAIASSDIRTKESERFDGVLNQGRFGGVVYVPEQNKGALYKVTTAQGK